MSFDVERLYNLLPAIYRIRDAEQGEPLKALLSLVADQAVVLEENLAQLYDDQFAETCAPWALPYIGDLIGLAGLPGASGGGLTPRAEVANTIGYRRRKGTAAMLEQLARDVTGWPARAVEFFQLLATTQYMNHLRPENRSFVNVRDANRLEWLGTPFERLVGDPDITHTVDVRRIARRRGRYNIPNVGIFLWRLRSYSLTRSPAVAVDEAERLRFFFNPLGLNTPLFNRPETEAEVTNLADPTNVPMRISRRLLARVRAGVRFLDIYYGKGKSLLVEREAAGQDEPVLVPSDKVIVCDLSDVRDTNGVVTGWAHTPPAGMVAVDPVLGRLAFAEAQTDTVLVSYHYGFSANIGGGEYDRINSINASLSPVARVANTRPEQFDVIQDALDSLGPTGGAVEVSDTGRYSETLSIVSTRRTELRAGDKRRPTVLLNGTFEIEGDDDAEVTVNGLLLAGAPLRVSGGLSRLRLLHCTLVPYDIASADSSAPVPPAVIIDSPNTQVEIESCIVLGGVRAVQDASVHISNSIIDAGRDAGVAYAALDHAGAGADLRVVNSTIIGKVHTNLMELASNTIFLAEVAATDDASVWVGPVLARRRQEGCVRFSFLPAGSRVPRRYHCQPETESDAARVRPLLASAHYNDPEYCQLSPNCPCEIRRGADDESEMGAFHDLYQPQREAHLRARLEEYLRFGLEAGIFYAT